jgi:hypothetical protein
MRQSVECINPGLAVEKASVANAPFVKLRWPVSCRCVDDRGRVLKQVSGTVMAISKLGLLLAFEEKSDVCPIVFISTIAGNNKRIGVRCKVLHTDIHSRGSYFKLVKYEAPEESCIRFIRAVVTSYNLSKCSLKINRGNR